MRRMRFPLITQAMAGKHGTLKKSWRDMLHGWREPMFKDMTGQRYGRLVAIEPTDKRRNGIVIWRFRCDCGKIVERVGSDVRRGDTQSCGCLFHELASERGKTIGRTHGGYYDRLHRVWTDMLTRCRNPNHSEFHRYGGRGIKVCEAWEQSYQAFKDWAYLHGYDDSAPRGALYD